jgi:hypothetical protein
MRLWEESAIDLTIFNDRQKQEKQGKLFLQAHSWLMHYTYIAGDVKFRYSER